MILCYMFFVCDNHNSFFFFYLSISLLTVSHKKKKTIMVIADKKTCNTRSLLYSYFYKSSMQVQWLWIQNQEDCWASLNAKNSTWMYLLLFTEWNWIYILWCFTDSYFHCSKFEWNKLCMDDYVYPFYTFLHLDCLIW